MKKKIGKIVALFMAAGLLVNSFFWSAANEGDNGSLDIAQEVQKTDETPHSHEWGNETVNEPAACNKDGSATVTCDCGETESRTIPATGEHNFGEWTQVTPAAADSSGEEKRVCKDCGAEEKREIPALGNPDNGLTDTSTDDSDGTVITDGTEITGGTDNVLLDGTENKGSDHEHKWIPVEGAEGRTEPTCKADGKQSYTCSVEGCTETKEESLPATGKHTVESWTEVKAPAETEAGSETGDCTVCGEKVTRSVPALNHKHQYSETGTVEKAATETEDGKVRYYCTPGVCDASIEGISHYYREKENGEFVCVTCGEKETPDGNSVCLHDWQETGAGISECRKCHSIKDTNIKLVPDEIKDADNKLPDVAEPCKEGEHIRPAVYEVLEKATCRNEGKIRYICTVCGETVTEATPQTAHIWDSKTGKCTVCGTACGHQEGDQTAFDSQTGKCKVCGYRCAHDFGEEGICKVCGFKECATHTKPTGPGAVIITVKAATCKTEGLVKYKCTVCGEEVTEKTAVDTDAHEWNSATGKCKLCDAVCEHADEQGETLYDKDGKCTVCGHVCEHEFTVVTEENKEDIVRCKECGYICKHDKKSLIPMKGTGDKEADCKNAGRQTYLCSICGQEIVKEIPLSGEHHYDESGLCRICGDDLHAKAPDDCEHKDWIDWDNDGTELDRANPWAYLKTDIDAAKDIFECGKCGSIWERDTVDREEKTVDLTQITKGTLGVTISVNGQVAGNNQEVKINKSDVLDIHIDWAVDNDRKPTSNTAIQYQLPVILKTVPMTGTIWGPGGYEEYGTFSINSGGLLTFKLNDKILKKSEINGSFDLQATLVLGEEGSLDKQEILFPGGAGITVYFKSNMTAKKEAKLNNDGSIDYKVTIELDSDSGNVSLTDTLAGNLTFEDYEGSFRLKNTATGTVTDITDKVEINGDNKIAVIDLGDVKKGKYEISYKAKLIDSSVKASSGKNTNTVTWKWDDKEGGPISCKVETTSKPLWKNSVNTTAEEKAQGIYRWEVVINKNGIPVNLSEKTIYDWYETNSGSVPNENTYIIGDITVTDVTTGQNITGQMAGIESKREGQSGNLADNCLFRIKFPYGDFTHVYKITYTTQTTANGMDGNDWGFVDLRNWAKIVETGDNDYEDALVGKKYTPGILTKAGKAVSNDNSDVSEAYKAQWQVKLDLSEFKNGDILKNLIITDTLPGGMTFYDADESEMNFAMALSDGTSLSEGTDYNKVISNNKKLLTVTFTEDGQRKCAGNVITMTFTSAADPSLIPGNGSKEYTNNATAKFVYNSEWSYKASAKVTMYRKDALNKSGTVLGKKNANGNYEIQWTILVNTNDAANLTPEKAYVGDITVTDTLPDGLTYVDGSAAMVTSTRTDWTVTQSGAVAVTPAPEGLPGRLIFTIPDSTYNNAYKITFKTEADPAKLDKTNLGTTFTNSVLAENNGAVSETEADVTIAEKDLLKKGGQTTGTHILYTIDVNTNAQKLTSQGVLTLEDEIDSNADILTNTISVKTVDILTQAETDITDSCSISYSGNKLIIGNIPDGAHIRVTYKAVTVRSGDVTVSNSAVLKGEEELASTVTTGTFKIKASATANGRAGTFTLIKLDSSDARKNLPGAEFTLYKFNMDNMDATPAEIATLTTDEDGRIIFGEGAMDELEFDVLFCYVETKAPANYKLDNTPHYFMLEGSSFVNQNQKAIERIGASADYRTYAQDGSKTRQLSNDPYTPPPTPPDTPDEPGTPGTPATPVTFTAGVTPKVDVLGESKMPDGAAPAAPGIGVLGDMKGPGTGDQAPVIFWTLLVCAAGAVLISYIVFRKKRKK